MMVYASTGSVLDFFSVKCACLNTEQALSNRLCPFIMGESLPKLMMFFPVSSLLGHPRLEIPFTVSIRFMFHVGENWRKIAMKEQGEKRSETRQD